MFITHFIPVAYSFHLGATKNLIARLGPSAKGSIALDWKAMPIVEQDKFIRLLLTHYSKEGSKSLPLRDLYYSILYHVDQYKDAGSRAPQKRQRDSTFDVDNPPAKISKTIRQRRFPLVGRTTFYVPSHSGDTLVSIQNVPGDGDCSFAAVIAALDSLPGGTTRLAVKLPASTSISSHSTASHLRAAILHSLNTQEIFSGRRNSLGDAEWTRLLERFTGHNWLEVGDLDIIATFLEWNIEIIALQDDLAYADVLFTHASTDSSVARIGYLEGHFVALIARSSDILESRPLGSVVNVNTWQSGFEGLRAILKDDIYYRIYLASDPRTCEVALPPGLQQRYYKNVGHETATKTASTLLREIEKSLRAELGNADRRLDNWEAPYFRRTLVSGLTQAHMDELQATSLLAKSLHWPSPVDSTTVTGRLLEHNERAETRSIVGELEGLELRLLELGIKFADLEPFQILGQHGVTLKSCQSKVRQRTRSRSRSSSVSSIESDSSLQYESTPISASHSSTPASHSLTPSNEVEMLSRSISSPPKKLPRSSSVTLDNCLSEFARAVKNDLDVFQDTLQFTDVTTAMLRMIISGREGRLVPGEGKDLPLRIGPELHLRLLAELGRLWTSHERDHPASNRIDFTPLIESLVVILAARLCSALPAKYQLIWEAYLERQHLVTPHPDVLFLAKQLASGLMTSESRFSPSSDITVISD
jgi:hypothetical protein